MTPLEQLAADICFEVEDSGYEGAVGLLLAFAEQVRRETVEEALIGIEKLRDSQWSGNGSFKGGMREGFAESLILVSSLLAPPAESKEEEK